LGGHRGPRLSIPITGKKREGSGQRGNTNGAKAKHNHKTDPGTFVGRSAGGGGTTTGKGGVQPIGMDGAFQFGTDHNMEDEKKRKNQAKGPVQSVTSYSSRKKFHKVIGKKAASTTQKIKGRKKEKAGTHSTGGPEGGKPHHRVFKLPKSRFKDG